jgi:hypothetical protein
MPNIGTWWLDGKHAHGNGPGATSPTKIGNGALKPPWTTVAEYAAGNDPVEPYAALNCTTCHGAHGSGSIANLRNQIYVGGKQMTLGGNPDDEITSQFESMNGVTTYTLPLISAAGNTQQHMYWGAWCTFCHNMSSHPAQVEQDSCPNAHAHGGNNF